MAVWATKTTGGSFRAWKVDVSGMLRLAAAPTFLLMGAISAFSAPGMIICTATMPWSPIGDMALMYLLMGAFHLSPWLKLLSTPKPKETDKCNML